MAVRGAMCQPGDMLTAGELGLLPLMVLGSFAGTMVRTTAVPKLRWSAAYISRVSPTLTGRQETSLQDQ